MFHEVYEVGALCGKGNDIHILLFLNTCLMSNRSVVNVKKTIQQEEYISLLSRFSMLSHSL